MRILNFYFQQICIYNTVLSTIATKLYIRSSEVFLLKMFEKTVATSGRWYQGKPELWLRGRGEGSLAVGSTEKLGCQGVDTSVGSVSPFNEKWLPGHCQSQHCQLSESASAHCSPENWILAAANWQSYDPCIHIKGLFFGLISIVQHTYLDAISKVSKTASFLCL